MKQPLATDLILAVIAPAPLSTTELARRFDVSPAMMTARMAQLVVAGWVKRHSTTGRWAPVVLVTLPVANLEAVLEQLRFGPKAISQMVTALGSSWGAIERALEQLRAARRVKTIGRASGARWVTADWTPAIGRRTDLPKTRGEPVRLRGTAAFSTENTVVLPKRAPTPVSADGTSWWVPFAGADQPREAFRAAAARRNREGVTDPLWRRGTKVIVIGAGVADV